MTEAGPSSKRKDFSLRDAARFWERGRIWYSAVLSVIVLLWLVLTWPHFRPALTFTALGKMAVLALLANVCYSGAYLAEFFMQPLLPPALWRRFRQALWVVGVLLAIVLENYWIADEIYPDVTQGAAALVGNANVVGGGIASNMNFPAPLAVLGFLSAFGGLFLAVVSVLIFWFARKPRFARMAAVAIATGGVIYFALLLGFSAGSRSKTLSLGQEKYFCEIDCHLAYAVVDVKTEANADSTNYLVTLRTRFDGTTTSPNRPKDAPLTPSPREVRLVDGAGHSYTAESVTGTPLMTALNPAESYTTQLKFRVPKSIGGLRLLLNTTPGWPDHVVIEDENSWLHKKTYFAL